MKNYNLAQKIYVGINLLAYLIILVLGIISIFTKNVNTLWLVQSIVGIALLVSPFLIEKIFNIKFTFIIYLIYSLFIFITIYLGYIFNFYNIISFYDIITHCLSGVLLVLLGIIFTNYALKLNGQANKFLIAIFGLIFALACGFVWELIEFSIDLIFGSNMQKFIPEISSLYNGGNSFVHLNGTDSQIAEFFKTPNGYKFALMDTMLDLVYDLVGAIIGLILFLLLGKQVKQSIYFCITKNKQNEN
ncbi:MAG: hypothetical protein IJZ29_03350 [Clostridia bacterium]|nr:hypothetical protein [Clostridia bacterium]